jgi:toxin ParE1/3/4
MSFAIRISDEAISDIDESYIWYDFQQSSLGDDFANTIDNSFRILSLNAQSFPIVHKNIRKYVLPRFPFNIYYRINVRYGVIEIIRILHHKRDKRKILYKTLRRR